MSKQRPNKEDYCWFLPMTTRWMDNDVYGHVNNVVYYSWFDTVVNRFLTDEGGFDFHGDQVIGYIVQSECSYHQAVAFPQDIEGALRVERLGNSSVQYGVAIFKEGQQQACAHGTFTHVFVDRDSERPVTIPPSLRESFSSLLV